MGSVRTVALKVANNSGGGRGMGGMFPGFSAASASLGDALLDRGLRVSPSGEPYKAVKCSTHGTWGSISIVDI